MIGHGWWLRLLCRVILERVCPNRRCTGWTLYRMDRFESLRDER